MSEQQVYTVLTQQASLEACGDRLPYCVALKGDGGSDDAPRISERSKELVHQRELCCATARSSVLHVM